MVYYSGSPIFIKLGLFFSSAIFFRRRLLCSNFILFLFFCFLKIIFILCKDFYCFILSFTIEKSVTDYSKAWCVVCQIENCKTPCPSFHHSILKHIIASIALLISWACFSRVWMVPDFWKILHFFSYVKFLTFLTEPAFYVLKSRISKAFLTWSSINCLTISSCMTEIML